MTDHEERYRRLIADLDQLVGNYLDDCNAAEMPPEGILASTVTALSEPLASVIAGALDTGLLDDWQAPLIDALQPVIDHRRAARQAARRAAAEATNHGAVH